MSELVILKDEKSFWQKASPFLSLASFVFICFFVAALGAFLTSLSVNSWYPALIKPSWTPPNYLFGPVWTMLYLMMAISAWLVWKQKSSRKLPMVLFFSQLFLNLIWSGLFFTLQSPFLGLIDITLLCLAIIATMISFWRENFFASLLLFPYLLWVSYATALNFAIWKMNS